MTEASFGKRRLDRAGSYAPQAPAPRPHKAYEPPPALAWATPAPKAVTESKYYGPVCTIGILAGLIAIFFVQEMTALGAHGYGFNYRSLLAAGADSRSLLGQGQWWRLFTAPLLHGNPGHLIGNGVALALVGLRFERLVGWGWFLAVFFVSALGGDLMSVYSNDPQMLGVGASGAIMGLLACMLVCSFHTSTKGQQIKMRWLSLRIMIPALLPLGGNGHAGLLIDYSAHAGGATAGVVMGLLINALWPQGEPKPVLRLAAEWLGVVGLVTAVSAFAMAAVSYPGYQAIDATLVPDALIPADTTQAVPTAEGLVSRYPNDPRLHFYIAIGDLKSDLKGLAAAELRTALGERDQLRELSPEFTAATQYLLAMALLQDGDNDAARAAAAPICGHAFTESDVKETLARSGLCGPPRTDPQDPAN